MAVEQALSPEEQLKIALGEIPRLLMKMTKAVYPDNIGSIGMGLLGLEASIARLSAEITPDSPAQPR